jgi:hypothetical protein
MKQKKALKNVIDYYNPCIKKFFISEWLEDINWRSENGLFNKQHVTDIEHRRIKILSDLHLAKYTRSDPIEYIADQESTVINYRNLLDSDDKIYLVGDQITISTEELRDFHRARKEVRTFSKVFGWCICNEDWNSRGASAEFVNELAALADDK